MSRNNAFTLIELMIVIVVLGIMAAFAIPNFTKSLDRAYARDARNNLMAIHAAQQIYHAQNGTYWPAGGDLVAINNGLRLNVIANGVTYTCDGGGSLSFTCSAVRGSLSVTVDQNPLSSTNPTCPTVLGTCNN